MSRRDIEKSRKNNKETYTAYEIYQKTQYLLWPVLLWMDEILENQELVSKKTKILNALSTKPAGLYFFTPGTTEEVVLYPLNGKIISKAKIYISNLKKVQKDFKKKFFEPDEWFSRINSRLHFLKKINAKYEQYLQKSVDSLPLEDMIYFATDKSQRPSEWLSIPELQSFENKRYKILCDIILLQKGIKIDWDIEWANFLKKQSSIPVESLTKIYINKLATPFTLNYLSTFSDSLTANLFEELRLIGEKLPNSLNYLPKLYSELQKFLVEPELRACLCRDFIRSFINNEYITHEHRGKYYIQFSEMNRFAKQFLSEHPEIQQIAFDRENFTIFDVFHWFTGVDVKQLKKELFCPKSFLNKQVLNNFEASFFQKCMTQMPEIKKNSFFKISSQFLSFTDSNHNSDSIINILSICREFIPPGNNGKNALNMAEFVFQSIQGQSTEYINWLSKNLKHLLFHVHNKTMNKQFRSPEFEKSSKALKKVLAFTPQIFNSNLEPKILLNSKYLFGLIDISPNQNSLQWIFEQDDEWIESAISDQDDWYYVMKMPDEFCHKVLDWSKELKQSGFDWSSIAKILDKIDDVRTFENQNCLANHLNVFKKIYHFSKHINTIINDNLKNESYDSFYDICSFFSYIDKLEYGWQNISKFWDLFFEYIENYIKNLNSADFDIYQEENKIDWLSCFKVTPEQTVRILNIIPVSNYELYEQTLEPLKWLSNNQPAVFDFLNNFLKDRESFNRISHLLKIIKISLRLDKPELKQKLTEWVKIPQSSPLEELKTHRRMAKFSNDFPANIRKIIDLPQKLKSEQESLTNLLKKGILSESAEHRLKKVSQWLKDSKTLSMNIDHDLNKHLPESIANAKMDSLYELSENICKEHWFKYSGRPIDTWNDDWRNAIQLCFFTESNKRILRKLMINAAGNDFQWIYYHPKNQAFLNQLPSNFNQTTWLLPPKLYFKIGKKTFSVEAEKDLLKILQMGNYFDSCLSVDQMNGFSTVSNAVEINKHVLWIKNNKGRIVGRKLIVLNQFGELYGYNSYGAGLGSNNENPWFKIILDLYCQIFIKECGGELQNKRREDEKLILFLEWYDDGIEKFDGWVMDLQKGKDVNYISKKVKFKTSSDVNLRAALWLNTQNGEIVAGWGTIKLFQKYSTNIFSITQN